MALAVTTLHVLTAVTRPWNLPRIANSLEAWGPDANVHWHIGFDTRKRHVGGQAVKNRLLEAIDAPLDWIWFCDDDTTAHPLLYRVVEGAATPESALIVSQKRADGAVLQAHPRNVYVGGIDIGQAILRRKVIAHHRIPETYAGDGEFLQAVLGDLPGVVYLPEILSYHNAIQ